MLRCTTKIDIVQFLKETPDKLPQAENQQNSKTSLLFLDHLNSHVRLQKAEMKGWGLQLTPVTCPDANVIECVFSNIKAHLRKVSVKKDTMKVTPWIQHVKKQIVVWYNAYKAHSGIFNHCREFVDDLIQSGGDLQLAKLNKKGFESIKEFQNSISSDDIG
jgi:transposase